VLHKTKRDAPSQTLCGVPIDQLKGDDTYTYLSLLMGEDNCPLCHSFQGLEEELENISNQQATCEERCNILEREVAFLRERADVLSTALALMVLGGDLKERRRLQAISKQNINLRLRIFPVDGPPYFRVEIHPGREPDLEPESITAWDRIREEG
jgi:hypothetical protein